jgi:hypothetical protein
VRGITWEERLQDALDKAVITAEEAKILAHVRELVAEIIAVDEFDTEELAVGRRPDRSVDTPHAA